MMQLAPLGRSASAAGAEPAQSMAAAETPPKTTLPVILQGGAFLPGNLLTPARDGRRAPSPVTPGESGDVDRWNHECFSQLPSPLTPAPLAPLHVQRAAPSWGRIEPLSAGIPSIEIERGVSFTLGRTRANMVRTKDSRASGQHLTIRWEVQPEDLAPGLRRVGGHPPGFQLQDHSHNGTWIRRGEKKWLLKGTRVALQNGDIVSLVRAYSCPTHGPSCDGRQAGVSDACSTESAPPEEGGVQTPLLSLLFLCGESQDPGPPARGRGEVAVAAGILPFAEAQALARAEAAGDDACEDQEPDGESWAPPARHSPLAGGGSTLWRDAEKDDGVQERFQQRTASEGAEKSGAVLLFPLRPKSASRGAPRAMPASAKQDPLLLSPSAALLPAVSPQAASVRGSGAGTPPRPAMESILADMSSPPPPPPPKTADGVRRPPSRRMATPVPGTRAESRPATGASVVREARREVGDAEHDRGDGTTAQTGARPLEAKPLPPAQALRSGRPPSRGGTHLAADEGSQMLIAEEPRDEPLPLAPWSKVCISSPSLKKKSSTDNAPTYRSLAVVTPVKLPVSASKLPLSASKRRPLQPKNDNVAVL